jgi:chromosome segregation ATPase
MTEQEITQLQDRVDQAEAARDVLGMQLANSQQVTANLIVELRKSQRQAQRSEQIALEYSQKIHDLDTMLEKMRKDISTLEVDVKDLTHQAIDRERLIDVLQAKLDGGEAITPGLVEADAPV